MAPAGAKAKLIQLNAVFFDDFDRYSMFQMCSKKWHSAA
jgi:hypothetical protein